MKTEDIEYNGRIFSCRSIIDISTMVELLGLLAKRQQYLEDKLNFQEERINDKDKRISELELMIKGVSLSKEEKFPSEKEIPVIKKEIKNELDDDLDAFLNNDNKVENKNNYINEIKQETNNDMKEENSEENEEERPAEKVEEKQEKKVEEKPEEKMEEKPEKKVEVKQEEKVDEKPSVDKKEENKENKNDGDIGNINNDKEEIENKININFEQKQSPTIVTKQNLSNTENNQTSTPKSPEKKATNIESKTNTINITDTNQNYNQNQNIPQEQAQNSQNDEILKKIVKKIKLLESKIDKLQQNESVAKSQSISQEKSNKSRLESRINLLNNKIDQLEDDQKKMKEDISKIKEKTDDFNVYDLFKGNSGDTNIDAAKGLIMNLENKIYKKLGLYDLKFKKDEEDIFQNKNDIKNMNNLLNGLKDICAKNTKDINDLKENNENKYVEINKFISEINNKIKDIDTKMNTNVPSNNGNIIQNKDNANNKENTSNNNPVVMSTNDNNDFNQINEKIKELENKISELSEELELLKSSNDKDSKEEKAINPEQLKLIKDISTRTNELEKHMKIILSELNIKEVYERLDALEKDLNKKGNKFEISELKEKLLTLEENEKDLNFKMDQMQQFNEKIRGDMQQIIKKIEYLSGQINRISNETVDSDKNKGPIFDVNKFVDLYLFNEKQKEINKKFDKIRLSFEEVARNIDDIIQKLSHVPSDKDFSQFQSIIRTMIDDLKLGLNKKYAEKTETSKSIKFLETQIKTVQESFQKKIEGADNWLLAKKPLNNYVCASCESIIKGELGKKSEFVPWNKYPNREEKSYRYGHGFSRMLQLINEDKKRELKEKDSMSDGGSDSEPMFKLPKLKRLHINSGKLKNNYNNNAVSDDENNVPYEKNGPYNDLEPLLTEERPKIMKIVKRSKNVASSSYLNRLDKLKDKDMENPANLIVKTVPNNVKEGNQNGQNEMNIINNNNE